MKTMYDADLTGKKVLLRVDLNSPLENGQIAKNPRIAAHAKTISDLSDMGAKVVVLSHQGRKGKPDFTSLEQHGNMLNRLTGKKIVFVSDVIGENVKKAIASLNNGDIILLDNVRKLDDETESCEDSAIVKELSPLFDCFILDALSIAHRGHASVVGFTKTMPSYAGRVLNTELEAINKVKNAKDITFFFGGSKIGDSFKLIKKADEDGKLKKVLVGGALAVLFLHAADYPVADSYEYLEESGILEYGKEARDILEFLDDKLLIPTDVGLSIAGVRKEALVDDVKKGQIFDIGERTIGIYVNELRKAETIVANGPAGVYELDNFSKGTKAVLEAIAESKGYSLLGGGHTLSAIEKFNIDKGKFGYVSLAGTAMMDYLCGKELVAIKALEENQKRFLRS